MITVKMRFLNVRSLLRLCILLCAYGIFGEIEEGPVGLLGKGPAYIVDAWGIPDTIYSQRAERPEWDVVVFSRKGYSLFWVGGLVWQMRFDESYEGSWNGLKIGISDTVVDGILGKPWIIREGMRIYSLAGYTCPVQIRCFFRDNALVDMYIYRSDF